jgi:hypothetical protein
VERTPPIKRSQDISGTSARITFVTDKGYIPNCECGKTGEAVCVFCGKGLCKEHFAKMAVIVNQHPMSRVVAACKPCGEAHKGKVPSQAEAQAADFLLAIKPYHEWGFV